MDSQIRNFRDFLQLYNRITELCFSNCVDNFFNREISRDETACIDKCVQKFTRVNQRIMNVYVEVQSTINERRIAEMEAAQLQIQQAQPAVAAEPLVAQNTATDVNIAAQASTTLAPETENSVR